MERQLDGCLFEKTAVATKPKPLPLGSGCYHITTLVLLSQGADVNAVNRYGSTPLHSAATSEKATVLLENGADVNAVDAKQGETPLHRAVGQHCVETVSMLLEHGADVMMDKQGETPYTRQRRSLSLIPGTGSFATMGMPIQ